MHSHYSPERGRARVLRSDRAACLSGVVLAVLTLLAAALMLFGPRLLGAQAFEMPTGRPSLQWELDTTRALFTTLAVLAILPLGVSLYHLRRLVELHHGYYGLVLVALGNMLAARSPVPATVCVVVGALLTAEDTGQHGEQAWHYRRDMPRLTGADDHWPVHRAYAWVLAWLREQYTRIGR